MARISLYTDRKVFATGLERTVAPSHQLEVFDLSDVPGGEADQLFGAPDLFMLDAPPEASHLIGKLRAESPEIPLVVWERVLASEPALNALGSGVQGVLLDISLPAEVEVCLDTVLAGGIWVPACISKAIVSSRLCKLTRREGQLVGLVAQGLRNKEIAYSLGIVEGTVKVYLSHLFEKLGVADRYELALLALRHGGSAPQGQSPSGVYASDPQTPMSMYIPRRSTRWTQGVQISA